MCDYSLDFVASRPAKVGDELVTNAWTRSPAGLLATGQTLRARGPATHEA
jgi:hypothetical protein